MNILEKNYYNSEKNINPWIIFWKKKNKNNNNPKKCINKLNKPSK